MSETQPIREIELDDDGWWTVWEDGEHIGLFMTEREAHDWLAELEWIERVDQEVGSR